MSQSSDGSPVLILGGNGYIGSHVVEELLLRECPVRVLSRHTPGLLPDLSLKNPLLQFVRGDLSDPATCSHAIDGCRAVIHCVGPELPSASNHNPVLDWHQHVEPTLLFLRLLRAIKPIRLLFISSGGTVYGPNAHIPTREDSICQPVSAYGIHKLMIENFLFLENYLHGLDYIVARISNPYGGRQRSEALQGAPSVFLSKILKGEAIDLWGDGRIKRDFIHVTDVTDALIRMLDYKGIYRVFNIASSQSFSMAHLIKRIEFLTGCSALVNELPSRPFDVPVNELDIELAKSELSWMPKLQLDEGLKRSIQALK